MTGQDQRVEGNQIHDSQVQLNQAGRDTVSFQNSRDNQVTINNALFQFGRSTSPGLNWHWAERLLKEKQLPEIRKRLIDTLGRERALLAVNFKEQFGWVGRSSLEADRVLQIEGEAETTLDSRQLLIETFARDDIARKLLILGAPGSGKTTALLSLAEQLVCGAIEQPKTVIPVLFELSTWSQDKQSIRDWLIEQLYDQHGGNRRDRLYEQWLDQQVLLPLMDGLDELGFERQQKCTQKLNDFAGQYPHLAVCCRTKEFVQAGIKLNTLNGAIRLKPLSDQQIQIFLHSQNSSLWSAIEKTPHLRQLLDTASEGDPGLLRIPLFLALAARIYIPEHPFETKEELLTQYIDWQLSQDVRESDRRNELGKKSWAYPTLKDEPDRQKTQKKLAWFARKLQEFRLVELTIEHIQPTWLEAQRERKQYRLLITLLVGPIIGILIGMFAGLLFGLLFGLIFGLIFGAIEVEEISLSETFKMPMSLDARRDFFKIFRILPSVGLIFVLIFSPLSAVFGDPLVSQIRFPFIIMSCALLLGMLGGIYASDLQSRPRPNQGIWNSLQSFFWTTVFSYPLWVILLFFYSKRPWAISQDAQNIRIILSDALRYLPQFLVPGLFAALMGGLMCGGIACVQHFCLRWVLWRNGFAPWNLARFLNYCVERRLLQRVGGRYRFLHRELLDHFANMF